MKQMFRAGLPAGAARAALSTLCALGAAAQAQEPDAAVLAQAAKSLVAVQMKGGEYEAIKTIQNCYAALPQAQPVPWASLQVCLAQDIGYSQFQIGYYRTIDKLGIQPAYTLRDTMAARVREQVRRAGLNAEQGEAALVRLAPQARAAWNAAFLEANTTR